MTRTVTKKSVRPSTRGASGILQRACACGGRGGACSACDEKKKGIVQRRSAAGHEPSDVPARVYDVLRASGQPLERETRAFFEPRFGRDFSNVRIHADANAAESAVAVNALAYTVGSHVVLGPGQYHPQTPSGRRLLGHELAHVVQQDAQSAPSSGLRIGAADSAGEREADRVAETVSAESVPASSGATPLAVSPTLQRTAASCPADWRSRVSADHSRALDLVDSARTQLSGYDGSSPANVKSALDRHFKASSSAFAGWVNFNLGFLRLVAPLASYDCEDRGSWWCDAHTLAKTFWCVPGIDIRVCQPIYFGQSDRERSVTLIHEWVHKYGCNFDLGYSHEADYASQWTISALLNADPFAQLVGEIA